ncbi:hypothetical protein HZC20_03690 [Candidatus Peregrinibacteria bacterium]|nr:hypothetical protein [Candidatus Peregrinibacteria bacterium]
MLNEEHSEGKRMRWTIDAINRDRATLDEFAREVRLDAGKFLARHGARLDTQHVSNAAVEGIGEGQRLSRNSCVTINVSDRVFVTPKDTRKNANIDTLEIATKIAALREAGCIVCVSNDGIATDDHIKTNIEYSIKIPLWVLMGMEISDADTAGDARGAEAIASTTRGQRVPDVIAEITREEIIALAT